jgi:uncharacterized protein
MPHPLIELPELIQLESGRGLVRIPMEQDVPFTPRVRALVDTREFQRLRHISQLGLTSLVYPGATHTRFEHALGVFHNSLRYLWQLGKDPRLAEVLDSHGAELLMASALLHDLGHWPFCHAIEDLGLEELGSHEAFAAEFLAPHRELAQVLSQEWGIGPDEILDVLVARTSSPPMRLIRSVLSGPIDIDKMDYLDRDSLHCGVPYGRNFDRQRLMQSLVLNQNADGLAVTSKGRTAAELMVFARYVMFSEVYWHHAVRAATSMFARGFYELRSDIELSIFFQQTEAETIADLWHRAAGTSAEPLVEGLFGSKRRLYKSVAEFSFYQTPELYHPLARKPFDYLLEISKNLVERLKVRTGLELRPTEVLIDAPPPNREVEFNVPIFFPKEEIYRPLHEVSPVVESLARTQFDDYVKRVRIFVHPDQVSRIAEHVSPCLREMLASGSFR